MKLALSSLILYTLFSFNNFNAQGISHPNSNKVIFSTELGFSHSYTDYVYPRPQFLSRASIEYFFPSKSNNAFGLKILGGLSKLSSHSSNYFQELKNNGFNTNILFLGAGITYARKIDYAVTYISLIRSHLRIDPRDPKGELLPNNFSRKYDLEQSMYIAEFGVRFNVNDLWSFNMGINYNLTNTDYIDDLKIGSANDNFTTLFFGISIYHGSSDNETKKLSIKSNESIYPNKRIFERKISDSNDTIDIKLDYILDEPETIELQNPELNSSIALSLKENAKINIQPDKPAEPVIQENRYNFQNEISLKDNFFTDGKLYCFQVASFKSKTTAERYVSELIEKFKDVFILEAFPFNNDEVWYRIRVGFFNSLDSARSVKNKL